MELYREIARILETGGRAALATVVKVVGPTPGRECMKLLVRDDGTTRGSIGGGCVEADVVAVAREVMDTERPRVLRFELREDHVADDSGLICGGNLEIFVEPIVAPTLYLFGGGHISGAIARVANGAGFRVVVADDRETFANSKRFPMAEELHAGEYRETIPKMRFSKAAYIVVVTRGHAHDEEVLERLIGVEARYIGMIGSQRKVRKVFEHLKAKGVSAEALAVVHAPVGLEIGAETHEEIAISIVAEMIQVRRGLARLGVQAMSVAVRIPRRV
ncbi:MAG: XdhC family protein [Planctomycetes bacterium]|nr:XdhC family protein [Planctomycetota bacterium]MBI3843267.1 XdhC family protein [Planctomycetota bacterium]